MVFANEYQKHLYSYSLRVEKKGDFDFHFFEEG